MDPHVPRLVVVDPSSPLPPFEQVRDGVASAVRTGGLAAGERLPTVRKLAADLGLASNTVARAYRELEEAGVVETRGRNGTFVAAHGSDQAMEAALATTAYAKRLRELGIGPDEAAIMVRRALS
ncbi:MAG TPA: GntR family transcriptional regulator [Propionicimonas sp.]|uniref:GntR family transcriptional regulator n=1 Tax=Propionicimonas sp. TaxID=1955623 RepID=UPI002F42D866